MGTAVFIRGLTKSLAKNYGKLVGYFSWVSYEKVLMDKIRIMHLVDTLELGGAERVAVNLVNFLPRERYQLYLCTTRRDGPLDALVAQDVGRLRLRRRYRLEPAPIGSLVRYIRANQIKILHAHSTSLFIAVVVSFFPPFPIVVWHNHNGGMIENHHDLSYWLLTRRIKAVIAVNRSLSEWNRRTLKLHPGKIWCIPNFVVDRSTNGKRDLDLPGVSGKRLVCVANFRQPKDHFTLIKAMAQVVRHESEAQLVLVGKYADSDYVRQVTKFVREYNLEKHIIRLGERKDVMDILKSCDIGVVSSSSEGFPLSLLEYGIAGLAAIATRVGQCAEILGEGKFGMLVPASNPEKLAKAILEMIKSPKERVALGESLRQHVRKVYNSSLAIKQISAVYTAVLKKDLARCWTSKDIKMPRGKC